MSGFELIDQVLLGNLETRLPVSIWKHHPNNDRSPQGLADAEIAFHREFDHDLIKISFHGRYPVVDWGCVAVYDGAISGSTTCSSCAVSKVGDWEVLEPLDVNSGEFGRQVRAVELISVYAQDKVPTIATLFDPAMVADKLCDGNLMEYVDKHPSIMEGVLDLIARVMVDFGRACIEAGADGLFIASQHSTVSAVTDDIYRHFVLPYDLKMISQLRGKSRFIVMHLHGSEKDDKIRFERISGFPGVDAINWEDQSLKPSLREVKRTSRRAVFGGIDHSGVLRTGSPEGVEEQVLATIRQAGLRSLVAAPGCVITTDTPPENIHAAINAVRSINPTSKEWGAYE